MLLYVLLALSVYDCELCVSAVDLFFTVYIFIWTPGKITVINKEKSRLMSIFSPLKVALNHKIHLYKGAGCV